MMNITVPQLTSFALVYLLLLVIIAIFKKAKIDQSRLLFIASLKMTIQLIIAGYILTFIFEDPNPLFTLTYLLVIFGFTVFRVLKPNQELNQRFKIYTATSIVASGAFVLFFFKLFDGSRQRRLLHMKPLGRACKMKFFSNSQKVSQVSQFHA